MNTERSVPTGRMRYVSATGALPEHVMVNGRPLTGTRLCLSNWPGVPTPKEFLGDSGAETVLRLLRSGLADEILAGIDAATSTRFDCGGLLALWALLNPDEALGREAPLTAAARAAEFGVSVSFEASAVVMTVSTYMRANDSPLAAELEGLVDEDRVTLLYARLLPQIGALLDNVKPFEMLWFAEYTDVMQSNALLHSGAVLIEMLPELDLVILDTPLRLHPLVRLTAAAGGSRLLTVRSENTFSLDYRYESWVQYQSRRPLPRIALSPLAARLNLFERRDGRWRAQEVSSPTPRLYFDDGSGRPSPSSIARETVVEEIADYLAAHRDDQSLLWSPYVRDA